MSRPSRVLAHVSLICRLAPCLTRTLRHASAPVSAERSFGIIAGFPIAIQVLFVWGPRASKIGGATATTFHTLAWLGTFMAVAYTVNWGSAEGGHNQNVDQVRTERRGGRCGGAHLQGEYGASCVALSVSKEVQSSLGAQSQPSLSHEWAPQ